MDEQKGVGPQGQPEGDEWRPPPPYSGLPVLLMVFMTVGALFNMAALLVIQDNRGLRYALAALMLAPVAYGWWVLARSRRRRLLSPTSLFPVLIGIWGMPFISRQFLQLADGRRTDDVGMTPLELLGLSLLVFVVVVVVFLAADRTQLAAKRRGRR